MPAADRDEGEQSERAIPPAPTGVKTFAAVRQNGQAPATRTANGSGSKDENPLESAFQDF